MRQPIKFLPCLKTAAWGGEAISRFKGLKINCKNIGESWELSDIPGCESIVMDGVDCGMTLADMVSKYKQNLVGQTVYSRYGDRFPLVVKFINTADELSVQMSSSAEPTATSYGSMSYGSMPTSQIRSGKDSEGCRYCPATGASFSSELIAATKPVPTKTNVGNSLVSESRSSTTEEIHMSTEEKHVSTEEKHVTTEEKRVSTEEKHVSTEEKHVSTEEKHGTTEEKHVSTEEIHMSDLFHVKKEVVAGERRLTNSHDSFMGLVCVSGNGSVKVDGISTSVKQGETLLLPAATEVFDVEGTMALLTIVIPTLIANPNP